MRKWSWIMIGAIVLLAVGAWFTPARYAVFPKPLTANQRAILNRASAGLAVFATKSPTANRLYQEALRSGRWSRFITVKPVQPLLGERGKAFSLTVISDNVFGAVAYYFAPAKAICFTETLCDTLGYLPLGLTYAHELGHRDDHRRRLVNISDLPNSRPFKASEARARLLEMAILQEFTAGRFSAAVSRHLKFYPKLPLSERRKYRVDRMYLNEDYLWVRQEFGNLTPKDQKTLASNILLAAGISKWLPKRSATPQDSLDAAIRVLDVP